MESRNLDHCHPCIYAQDVAAVIKQERESSYFLMDRYMLLHLKKKIFSDVLCDTSIVLYFYKLYPKYFPFPLTSCH